MKTLAAYNIKGGVGKTATAVNLAWLAAQQGSRTLLWDLDPQAAATYCFRILAEVAGVKRLIRGRGELDPLIRGTDYELLDVVPADFVYRKLDLLLDRTRRPRERLARLLEPLAEHYDWLFLDCAPGFSLVSEAVFHAADALLVPTIPTALSLRTLEQLRERARKVGPRAPALLPFFCMVDRRRSLHRDLEQRARERGSGFLSAWIPYASVVEQMAIRREPLGAFARHTEPFRAYVELWAETEQRLRAGPAARATYGPGDAAGEVGS